MESPHCGENCHNYEALKTFAEITTRREDSARTMHGDGLMPGVIACSGATGSFCNARLTPPVTPRKKDASWVCPQQAVSEIPGYKIFSKK